MDEIILYQTLPVVPDQEQLDLIARGIDAVLFTSSSTVRNFVAVLNDFCLSPSQLQGAIIVCIGPATARTAVELGLISSGLDSGENTIPTGPAKTCFEGKGKQLPAKGDTGCNIRDQFRL